MEKSNDPNRNNEEVENLEGKILDLEDEVVGLRCDLAFKVSENVLLKKTIINITEATTKLWELCDDMMKDLRNSLFTGLKENKEKGKDEVQSTH